MPGGPRESPNELGSHYMLEIQDTVVAFFQTCTGLEASYETYPYSEGGLNTFVHQLKGPLRYGNLTLTRGITANNELLKWFKAPKERSQRGTITIVMLDNQLREVKTWAFAAAWAVRYTGPSLDVDHQGMSIETIEIAHEGLLEGVS
jgi:phage tail-like protein